MKNNLKFIVTGIVAIIVSTVIASVLVGGNNQPVSGIGGETRLPNSNLTITRGNLAVTAGTLTVGGATTLSATTTIDSSPDGFIAWDDFTMATTGIAALYTNSAQPKMCDAGQGNVYWNSTAFSPSLIFSLGTSTSATAQTGGGNLVASTTIATTTTTVVDTASVSFVLANGESIVGLLADITNAEASSTNYANWEVEFGIHCWTLGQ
jgi:hypothetical protein